MHYRTSLVISISILCSIFFLMLSACSSGTQTPKMIPVEWTTKTPITTPLQAANANQGVIIGNINTQQVQVILAPSSFGDNSSPTVTVSNPTERPTMDANYGTPLGSPVDISIGEDSIRLNHLMQITIKFDQSTLPLGTTADEIWAVFYNGDEQKWDYIQPDSVDLRAGTMTFSAAHMCLWGAAKITVDEYIEKKVHSKIVAKVVQKDIVDKIVDNLAEDAIDNLLQDQLGIEEDSTKNAILSSLLKDDDWADIVDKARTVYANGKDKVQTDEVVDLVQTINNFAGQKLVDNIDKGKLQTALKTLPKYAEAVSQATAYLVEGNYYQAARIIGTKIADKSYLIKATNAAGEIIDYHIGVWKHAEVEAAFKAYRFGASTKSAYGYDVDKGQFNDLWVQMRGICERLENDAVAAEKAARLEGGIMDEISPREIELIKARVKTDMEAEFKERAAREDEIDKQKAEIKALMAIFKDKGFLDDRSGYRYALEEEQYRVDTILKIRDIILNDTAGKKVTNKDIVDLTQVYLSGTMQEGKAAYAALLKKRFNINIGDDDTELTLQLTYPAGQSPKVFTTGWIFGAKAVLETDEGIKDISSQVKWSGSGTFTPAAGNLSHPAFTKEGPNKIVLSVMIDDEEVKKEFEVNAVSPANYACVGTQVYCAADSHGCPQCPHAVTGKILTGSSTVTINGIPAARVGDTGTHSQCCGPNTFEISSGDDQVLIDGKKAARIGDTTKHCGGVGKIVTNAPTTSAKAAASLPISATNTVKISAPSNPTVKLSFNYTFSGTIEGTNLILVSSNYNSGAQYFTIKCDKTKPLHIKGTVKVNAPTPSAWTSVGGTNYAWTSTGAGWGSASSKKTNGPVDVTINDPANQTFSLFITGSYEDADVKPPSIAVPENFPADGVLGTPFFKIIVQ